MKKADKDQILGASPAELTKKATEIAGQISAETLKRQSANIKNVHIVKNLRRKLAVVLSVKRMKDLTQER